ncbi:MotA/TolQ/ExbB proton channel family protein [Ferrimonas senticii]|uniref:MotA/TolQ/ExbB proton channel family protein n=1 Tax=Ferrimonas senticii TaxID=394566 RepID=UPI00041AB046|nr:MotA/TolQ/ExbB proton channel family protein [Ferrimonas senticii]
MSSLLNQPLLSDLLGYLQAGGAVMWPLLLCCLLMLYLAAGLLLPPSKPHLLTATDTKTGAAAPAWLQQRQQQLALQRAAASQQGQLQGLKLLATTAPLLGLLGTVSAMITMFDAIGSSGLQHGSALSDGIAQAMITTQTGLLIGAPGLLLAFLWQRRLNRLQQQWRSALTSANPKELTDA